MNSCMALDLLYNVLSQHGARIRVLYPTLLNKSQKNFAVTVYLSTTKNYSVVSKLNPVLLLLRPESLDDLYDCEGLLRTDRVWSFFLVIKFVYK